MKRTDTYAEHVQLLEARLAPYSKRSFESFSQSFVDGGSIHDHYESKWRNESLNARLRRRTPLQIERDRIVYSTGARKQTEKYHVLYNGQRRIVRNYITHAMRLVQVTRAICRSLSLNGDFAEAIALGSKAGALPFIHASKLPVSKWVAQKIGKIDKEWSEHDPEAKPQQQQMEVEFEENPIPIWVRSIRSPRILEKVRRYIPWAAGKDIEEAYSSGQQSYWSLAANPYSLESKAQSFSPETMYGIWRHSLGTPVGKRTFLHRCQIDGATSGLHEISWRHATYEAMVVSYADDITWVIENINDANAAALLNHRRRGVYERLLSNLGDDIPDSLLRGLSQADSGQVYTYFISDFVMHSEAVLGALGDGAQGRIALREHGDVEALIGLSGEALEMLTRMIAFLENDVFSELRVANRARMLSTLSEACMELLYDGLDDSLPRYIEERAALERWKESSRERAREFLRDEVYRIQLAVNIFSDMGDQEIYDFVGIDSL